MIFVRPMSAADIHAVLKLQNETPEGPHWDHAAYERIVSSTSQDRASRAALVATDGRGLLGFAVVHFVAGVSELESIAVAKSARRKGIGRALLNAIAEWSRSSGAKKFELEVRAANESAIVFYERAGFLKEGLRPRYYRDPEDDAVLMGKRLYSDD
jgi:[ribosomal protein S18]-alanine N-acetyltransferase